MLEEYKDVLTIDDVCHILRIGRNKAYQMLKTGEIPNKKKRHKYIIPKQGVIRYLKLISLNITKWPLKKSLSDDIILILVNH